MTDNEKLVKKMDARRTAMMKAARRYRTVCQSVFNVVDAYNDTKDEMIAAGLWRDWCMKLQYATSHQASDYFA